MENESGLPFLVDWTCPHCGMLNPLHTTFKYARGVVRQVVFCDNEFDNGCGAMSVVEVWLQPQVKALKVETPSTQEDQPK